MSSDVGPNICGVPVPGRAVGDGSVDAFDDPVAADTAVYIARLPADSSARTPHSSPVPSISCARRAGPLINTSCGSGSAPPVARWSHRPAAARTSSRVALPVSGADRTTNPARSPM